MSKTLWSVSSLAAEFGRNFRTLRKALLEVKPDGTLAGRPAFHMSTAVAALAEHERRAGYARRPVPPRYDAGLEAQIVAIESASSAVETLLGKLRGERTLEARRAIVKSGAAKCIGGLERALTATISGGNDAFLRKLFVEDQMSRLISEVCTLCDWPPLASEA